ncbi:MAG: DUF2066 domain-containing protein [Pseudomonadales bacterium]
MIRFLRPRTSRQGSLVLVLSLAMLSFYAAAPLRAEVVDWLYQVAVPVADQSAAARRSASEEALLEVLTRISGMSPLPDSTALRGALSAPDRYYSQFRYLAPTETEPMQLRFDFAPGVAIELAKSLSLPVWWANRPRLVPWVVLPEGGGRLATNDPEDPFAAAFLSRARQRGVPVSLPELNELGEAPVSAARVLRGDRSALALAGAAYGGEVTGVARVQQRGGRYQSSWRIDLDDGALQFNAAAADLAGLGSAAADRLADRLAARFAASGGAGTLALRLTGVRTPTDFAALLDYLSSLEFVDSVQVLAVDATGMTLSVGSQAGAGRFVELLELDGQLRASGAGGLSLAEPGTVALQYRGAAEP